MIKIKDNGFLFQYYLDYKDFKGITNVFVKAGKKFVFICDSFVAPQEMEEIKDFISQKYADKRIIVFNSHYDFDHCWGNAAFEKDLIISNMLTKKKMQSYSYQEERKYYPMPKIVYPNLTFEGELLFQTEGVIFFHSPGHTLDSSSCYFIDEKILFAGDNLEYPVPFYQNDLIDKHIYSLEKYLKMDLDVIIFGHGKPEFNKKIIRDNLDYLKGIKL
jgi:glyoxylase-like metal-dependent hydrolase (beta-lactamase superfamily II)